MCYLFPLIRLHHFFLWGSIAAYFGIIAIFSASTIFAIGGIDYYFVWYRLLALPRFWFTILVTATAGWLCDFIISSYHLFLRPTPIMVAIEAERLNYSLKEQMSSIFKSDHDDVTDEDDESYHEIEEQDLVQRHNSKQYQDMKLQKQATTKAEKSIVSAPPTLKLDLDTHKSWDEEQPYTGKINIMSFTWCSIVLAAC